MVGEMKLKKDFGFVFVVLARAWCWPDVCVGGDLVSGIEVCCCLLY